MKIMNGHLLGWFFRKGSEVGAHLWEYGVTHTLLRSSGNEYKKQAKEVFK